MSPQVIVTEISIVPHGEGLLAALYSAHFRHNCYSAHFRGIIVHHDMSHTSSGYLF